MMISLQNEHVQGVAEFAMHIYLVLLELRVPVIKEPMMKVFFKDVLIVNLVGHPFFFF